MTDFNSKGEQRFNALHWLDYAATIRKRVDAGEDVTAIELSMMETVEKAGADAFDEGIPK